MALAERELSITYAGLTVGGPTPSGPGGGASVYQLHQAFDFGGTPHAVQVSFAVIVRGRSEAEFTSAEAALLRAYQTRRARLTLQLGSATRLDYDPQALTGFDAEPTIRKPGSPYDTARSALYRCGVSLALPSDQDGRAYTNVSVRTAESGKRIVALEGEVTAVPVSSLGGAADAPRQYEALITAHVRDLLDAIDVLVTWTVLDPGTIAWNDTRTRLRFSRAYEEVLDLAASGLEDDDGDRLTDGDLRNPRLFVNVREIAGQGSTAGEQLPGEVTASFACSLDKERTTDLEAKLPELLALVRAQIERYVGGQLVILEEQPSYEALENRVGVTVRAHVYRSNVIRTQITTEDFLDHGKIPVPLADGRAHSYRIYQGFPRHVRTVTREVLRRGQSKNNAAGPVGLVLAPNDDGGDEDAGNATGGGGGTKATLAELEAPQGFEILTELVSRRPLYIGLPGSRVLLEYLVEVVPMLRVDDGLHHSQTRP